MFSKIHHGIKQNSNNFIKLFIDGFQSIENFCQQCLKTDSSLNTSLSLSVSHTHTHTHTHSLSLKHSLQLTADFHSQNVFAH